MATYLCNKYAKEGCKLYPKDAETRAKIDDRLYYEATSFYPAFGATVVRYLLCTMWTKYFNYKYVYLKYPVAFGGATVTQATKDKFQEVCVFANDNVKKTGWPTWRLWHLTAPWMSWPKLTWDRFPSFKPGLISRVFSCLTASMGD
jgi:hypothetical protein